MSSTTGLYDIHYLHKFIQDSNLIEGIFGTPSARDVEVADAFLKKTILTVEDMCEVVGHFQPGARVRSEVGMNVRIGNHLPPVGGMQVVYALDDILGVINVAPESVTPYQMHQTYERLHPFTDGNGRSGRLLYAYHSLKCGQDRFLRLGFLHHWYYESLTHDPLRTAPAARSLRLEDLGTLVDTEV